MYNLNVHNKENTLDEFTEDFESYTIDYDKIAGSKRFLAVTRLTAAQFRDNPYATVGDFFVNLSDQDLETLVEVCEEFHVKQDEKPNEFVDVPHFEEVMLLGEMLAAGEGVLDRTANDVYGRTNHMMSLLAIESLHRKGLVKAHHENFSFGLDAGKKIIVSKI